MSDNAHFRRIDAVRHRNEGLHLNDEVVWLAPSEPNHRVEQFRR